MDTSEAGSGLQDLYANGTPMHEKFENDSHQIDNIAFCASPADYVPKARRKRSNSMKPEDSLSRILRKAVVDHQLGLSLNLLLLLALTHLCFPSLRATTSAFFALSYPTERQDGRMYGQGPRDLYLVAGCVVLFTATRAFCLDHLLMPLAGWCGIEKKKGRVRFAEQGYLLIYYVLIWTWGFLLFVEDTPTGTQGVNGLLISLWRDFPRLFLTGQMKVYYLAQLAFWVQQIFVVHIEEPRKDHYQMLTHHFITVGLLAGSYWYRQTRAGNAVLVLMDVVDLVFPLAKILRYLNHQRACDAAFVVFVVSWLGARHLSYLTICYSIYAHVNNATMPYGTYSTSPTSPTNHSGLKLSDDGTDTSMLETLLQPLLQPGAETVAFNARIRWLFLGLLLALQCVTIAWFVMICRVVVRVIRGEGADDSRSDDEGEDTEDEEFEEEEVAPEASVKIQYTNGSATGTTGEAQAAAGAEKVPRYIEIESSSEDYAPGSFTSSSNGRGANGSTAKRKSKGISSGLNLGEHKDILNRIGCLSEEQLARERERAGSMSPRPASSSTGGK